MEKAQKSQWYFLLLILMGVSILAFFIFRPFLLALVLAAVFSVVFQPVYQWLVSCVRGRHGFAALLTILIVVIIIFTPLAFLGTQVFQEAGQLYSSLVEGSDPEAALSVFRQWAEPIQKYVPSAQEFSVNINQYLKQGLSWLLQNLGSIFGSLAKMAINSFIFLIALYYLLKDGQKLKATMVALSPLSDADDEVIARKLGTAINSAIRGNILIALIQGVLTATGFLIFGVPNAILWGSIAAVTALIPGIGTALVLTPAILFLFLKGEAFSGIGLMAWGAVAVGLIDNLLGPKLVSRGMQIHPLIILLSVLGGIGFFGPLGFILGPLVMSLFFTLLGIYSSLRKENKML